MPKDVGFVSKGEGPLLSVEELWEKYAQSVWAYLFKMTRNSSDAEDLCQETFLKIHRSLGEYQDKNHEKAWVFQISRNTLKDYWKKKKLPPLEEDHDFVDSKIEEPHIQLHQKETEQFLLGRIDSLPPAQKEIVYLRLTSHLSFKEIAELTDLPLSRVLGRMHIAMKKLKEAYEGYDAHGLRM